MPKQRSFSDNLWLVFKGLAMGAANKVPGVSGGMVAFVAGFYEEFIYSLQKINRKALLLLRAGKFNILWAYINGKFLSLLILGMVISYFSVSKLLDYFLVHYELYVWSLFFGMIVGSIYYVAKDFGQWNRKYLLYLLFGVMVGVGISFLEPAKQNDHLLFVFLCGMIGVSGMTLPGLSGSFILIILGNYVLLLVDSVNALYDTLADIFQGDFSFMQDAIRIRLLTVLVVFSLGSLAGLVTLSHFLGFLLKHYKKATFAVIIGFITGSLGVVWPWKTKEFEYNEAGEIMLDANGQQIIKGYQRFWPSELSLETFFVLLLIIVGILIVLSLDWYYKSKNPRNG